MLTDTTRENWDLETLIGRADPPVARVLDKALSGGRVETAEALHLFEARGSASEALIRTADEVRRRAVGDDVSFVIVRNINFTNICYTGCRFCAFAKRREDEGAEFLSLEQVADRAEEAWRRGATEVCIQGGLHPELDGHYYRDILVAVKQRVPRMHVHAFSPFEIQYGARRCRMSTSSYLKMLKENGLDTMPGTAAEILDTDVRTILTRDKLSAEQWVHVVKTAHQLGIRTTSTIMYGHVDAPHHWAEHLALLRDIQAQTGGFTEFVPLGFVHHKAPIYLDGQARPGPTRHENLHMHAVARLMLSGWIDNVQVSWMKLGPRLAQRILNGGANDLGGTLMNENISRAAGAPHGQELTPAQMCILIRQIGRTPVQRNTTYGVIRRFEGNAPAKKSEDRISTV